MTDQPHGAPLDGLALAEELRAVHRTVVDLIATLPETRSYLPTDRDGWTAKHEIAYLAAAGQVLVQLLDDLARVPGEGPVLLAESDAALRRLRGEAMHEAKELRLTPLRDHLAALGEAAADAVERHAPLLQRPVALNGTTAPAIDHVAAHLQRTLYGIERLRQAMA